MKKGGMSGGGVDVEDYSTLNKQAQTFVQKTTTAFWKSLPNN